MTPRKICQTKELRLKYCKQMGYFGRGTVRVFVSFYCFKYSELGITKMPSVTLFFLVIWVVLGLDMRFLG